MRRLEGKHVASLPRTHNVRPPAPFPGKFPTWVAIVTDTGRFEYVGKPSRNFVQYLQKAILTRERSLMSIYEFDRKGVIAIRTLYTPMSRGRAWTALPPDWIDYRLFHYYHPWEEQDTFILPHFTRAFFVKRLKHNGTVHRVYSPYEKLKLTLHIEPFKQWMRENKIGDEKPPEQPKEKPTVAKMVKKTFDLDSASSSWDSMMWDDEGQR